MTRIERLRTAAAIPQAFRGTGRVEKSLELIQRRAAGTLDFNSNVWKAAKKQLKLETGGKCAYCESPTDTVAHGDVEHYRPKSKYWWLAYCYDNYLYACQICNQVHKGDEFPVHATTGMWTGPALPVPPTPAAFATLADILIPDPLDLNAGHALADFLAAAEKEKAGLVNPYETDPDPLFKWVADDVLKEVKVAAASNLVAAKRAFEGAEASYGLNREELKRNRWKTYAELLVMKDSLKAFESAGLQPALQQRIRDQIKAMTGVDAPYAGMVRYFVKEFQITRESTVDSRQSSVVSHSRRSSVSTTWTFSKAIDCTLRLGQFGQVRIRGLPQAEKALVLDSRLLNLTCLFEQPRDLQNVSRLERRDPFRIALID